MKRHEVINRILKLVPPTDVPLDQARSNLEAMDNETLVQLYGLAQETAHAGKILAQTKSKK